MPGDLLAAIAQKVFLVKQLPDPLDSFLGYACRCEQLPGGPSLFFLDQLFAIDRVFEPATQGTAGELVQVVKQGGFPRIPQLRIGAPNVGDSQDVQVVEVGLVTDQRRKLIDDFRILDVLFLRGHR